MGRGHDGKGGLAHSEGVCEDHWCRQISAARSASDLCSALPCFGRGSWSRSNFFWGTSQFKLPNGTLGARDRKSTRLYSSHTVVSYAVFRLKKDRMGNAQGREKTDVVWVP